MVASKWKDPAQTESMVVLVLTDFGRTSNVIAAELGVSASVVRNIRAGCRYASVRPDLPRWRSCERCGHWSDARCSLGLPDPEEVGVVQAGTECSAWVEA